MFSRVRFSVQVCVLAGFAVVAGFASTVRADYVVAYWQFNDNDFLADSSGNGHTLTKVGPISDTGGVATFDGTGYLRSSTIDLSPYRRITISWDEWNTRTTSDISVVFEHSVDFNYNPGAILCTTETLDTGSAGIKCDGSNYNVVEYSSGDGWEHFSATLDLDQANVADVVKVYDSTGSEIGWPYMGMGGPYHAPASFINALGYIGAREGGTVSFIGQLDNIKIEAHITPEPAAISIVVTGLLGLLAYACWKHK